jgi:chromosomal replication initiator protein
LEEIGGFFGGRDHTTVLHAERKVGADVAAKPDVNRQLSHIEGQLTG